MKTTAPSPILLHRENIPSCYLQNTQNILEKIGAKLPEFYKDNFPKESLPYIQWEAAPLQKGVAVTITVLCEYRLGASNFFYDIISRWLVPFKRLNIDLFFSSDFSFSEIPEKSFTVAELVIHLEDKEWLQAKESWKTLEIELKLGIASAYHANKIVEFKSLSSDKKTAVIQEKIAALMQNRSQDFDKSIFSHMQKFLVNCRDDFKVVRDCHHISRIISVLYMIRKTLLHQCLEAPNERHLVLKLLKTKLHLPGREKSVLGILVGMNLLGDYEVFEKEHFANAIKSYMPQAKAVEGSFIMDRGQDKKIQSLYIEIELEEGREFSLEEIQNLRTFLPEHLQGNIERLMHPIFMPRNEEEILRNIMSLSRQLKYVKDLPQVILSFEEQRQEELLFTVIFLRILKPNELSAAKMLEQLSPQYKVRVDRTRKLGTLRRKYAKEAVVFRISLRFEPYLRRDHSIDLYKARQDVIHLLQSLFGEIRDYNGGMILKETQLLNAVKASLGSVAKKQEILLDKFFYALFPVEMRSVLEVDPIKQLFLLLMQSWKKEAKPPTASPKAYYKEDPKRAMAVIFTDSLQLKKHLAESIAVLQIPSYQLVSFSMESQKVQGYMLLSDEKEKKQLFFQTIEKALQF